MKKSLLCPTGEFVCEALNRLELWQMRALAAASAVPYGTLYKIRAGAVTDPRLSTVNAIAPHFSRALRLR